MEHKSLSHNKFDNHSFTLHALQRNQCLARGGVVAAADVEGNAEIQAQVKMSVWVRNAFGGLFARGLYAQYLAEGEAFIPKYKKLLYTTTVATAEDTARVAGIDLTDKAFWRGALQTVADQIDLFCGLVNKE